MGKVEEGRNEKRKMGRKRKEGRDRKKRKKMCFSVTAHKQNFGLSYAKIISLLHIQM